MSLPDRAVELRAADGRARLAAQRQFDRPLVLEAGAGTGKTTALVSRIVLWSVGEGWRLAREEQRRQGGPAAGGVDRVAARVLDGIVAVTFTEAAAAEMAGRVGEVLTALAGGEQPNFLDGETLDSLGEELPQRAAALLGQLDRLQVTTIHSYCRGLLAAWPYEAGLHPAFTVDADESALTGAVRTAVEDGIREAFGSAAEADLRFLAARGVGPGELERALLAMAKAGLPPQALDEDPWSATRVGALRQECAAAVGEFFASGGTALATVRSARSAPETVAALARLAEALRAAPAAGPAAAEALSRAWAEHLDPKVLDRLNKWARKEFTNGEAAALGEAAGQVSAAARRVAGVLGGLGALQPELLDRARRVIRPMLEGVARRLRSEGAETFNALLADALELLRRHPEVAARERGRIRQLLVDEFQDTDEVQCDILRILARPGRPGGQPCLFLVGDPKQSIYGWRNADLRAYERFVAEVRAAGGEVANLSVNYRSLQPILDEVERCLAPVMVEEPGVQPGFRPLVANRGEGSGGAPRVEFWISGRPGDGGGLGVAAATEAEARAVARDIKRRWQGGELEPGRVGLLLRTTSDVEVYLAALRQEGVPYAVARDASYYRRREVVDAISLVRAVLDPADHVALVGWLRSPSVGVPDAVWLPLWRAGFPGLATALGSGPPDTLDRLFRAVDLAAAEVDRGVPGIARVAGWEVSLRAALVDLDALRRSFASDPASVFVEKLRRRTLLEVSEAARYLGAFRVANLQRFFAALLHALEQNHGNPFAVLRELRGAVAAEPETVETPTGGAPGDAVRVLTVHGAKGLDFDHVYLLQTYKQTRPQGHLLDEAERLEGRWEYRLLGVATPGWGRVAERRRRVAEAELVRLAYVALTRARERLVVCGVWPSRSSKLHGTLAGLLAHRWHSANLDELFAAAEAAGEGAVARDGVRFVFPALAPPAPDTPPQSEPALLRRSVAEVAAEASRLARLREEAARHMARPFAAAASAEAHRLLEEAAGEEVSFGAQPGGPGGSTAALLFGTAVHACLERLDLSHPLPEALKSAGGDLERELRWRLQGSELKEALRRGEELLRRLAVSPVGQRLAAVAGTVVARELPILLAPAGDAVGFVAGSADLVFRDPASGELVVADYKTDWLESEAEVMERAAIYARQGEVYVRGVMAALGLPRPPRFELWFLWPGRVVVPGGG